jgi:aspartyl-tRNA(Asn)/glutamyl-tRNA(Gln) amidotransferase subunit B
MSEGWETVVGLEVHCELATATKLFCGCPNGFGAEPNTHVCPVCLGLPGSLPVLNAQAVELAMRIGLALSAEVRPSRFHRKQYFYPDMPKNYQISQYDEPINVGGWLALPGGRRIGIVRAHLEEDTGKLTHLGGTGRIGGAEAALVDYNRAGVPLVEIVSQPDLRSGAEARAYVSELRAILVAIGASDGRMEEGSLRVDANVSVRRAGEERFGTRCEVKNLNSLRSLVRAIDYEAGRQVALLEAGEVVEQQTRHFDEATGTTSAMRSKEEAHDYRYFPDPDLVRLEPEAEWIERVRQSLPPLPAERRNALARALGAEGEADLPASVLAQVATVVSLDLDGLLQAAADGGADVRLALSRAANEAAARPDDARRLDPTAFVALIRLESQGALGSSQAKEVLGVLLDAGGGDPAAIAEARGLVALDAGALEGLVAKVVAEHPEEWERYVAGDAKVAGFLVGQVMRASGGKADGKAVRAVLAERTKAR